MKLNLFMKSGNVITVNGIQKVNIRYNGNVISYISVERKYARYFCFTTLMVESLSIADIEAITTKVSVLEFFTELLYFWRKE